MEKETDEKFQKGAVFSAEKKKKKKKTK